MSNSLVMEIMQSAALNALKVGAPILIISMIIGLAIAIFQAATQIHEQTITFVPKVVLIALVLLVFGSWMLETLQDFMYEIFKLML